MNGSRRGFFSSLIGYDGSPFCQSSLKTFWLVRSDSLSTAVPIPLCFGIYMPYCNKSGVMGNLGFYEGKTQRHAWAFEHENSQKKFSCAVCLEHPLCWC